MSQPHMVAGQWYDLDPPASFHGKKFPKVICKYQVPAKPNEYSVKGTPVGGNKEEAFLLVFRSDRGLKATPSTPPTSAPPKLKIV